MTHADRIRAMTDEELADWILAHDCKTNLYGYMTRDETLDLLKQEVTDKRMKEALKDTPSVDVRPGMRGEWSIVRDGYGICSNCHRGDHIDPLAGFCRFCGADMRKKGGGKR